MTISLAAPKQSLSIPPRSQMRAPQARANIPMTRNFEIAALRADDTQYVAQHKVPALPLFDDAFSAFAMGSLVSTTKGQIAVEDLQPGDMINTATGEAAKLVWIGSSTIIPAGRERRTPLIRIMADTFGPARPSSFLTVGSSARLLQTPEHMRGEVSSNRMFSLASEFVDGVNVIEVCPPTPVRLFHLCLERHAAITVGGMEVETFHPGNRALRSVSHATRDLFLSMFPHIAHSSDFGPLAHPRAPELEATILN